MVGSNIKSLYLKVVKGLKLGVTIMWQFTIHYTYCLTMYSVLSCFLLLLLCDCSLFFCSNSAASHISSVSQSCFCGFPCPPGSRGGVSGEDAGFRAKCCRRMALRIQGKGLLLHSSTLHHDSYHSWRSSLDAFFSRENHTLCV